MRRSTSILLLLLATATVTATVGACSTLQQLGSALANARKLQFKLGDVNGFAVNGVDISRLTSLNQINPIEIARLTRAVSEGRLPVSFTLNVLAKNPNDGTGGTKATPLYLSRMDWTLHIDDTPTISGVVDKQLEIPGSGQTTTIPLTMQLDLMKFFGGRGLDDLLNLALAIGGAQGSSSRLKLTSKVQVTVPGVGTFNYPGELTIVDTQFTNP